MYGQTSRSKKIGNVKTDMASRLLVEVFVVEGFGMLYPTISCKQAGSSLVRFRVCYVEDDDSSDFAIGTFDVLDCLVLRVLPGLALRDLANQGG